MSKNTELHDRVFDWTVIGAGPSGIAVIGKLIDHGVNPNNILWLDECFNVGDFGSHWFNVQSNSKVKYFLRYLNGSQAFDYKKSSNNFKIQGIDVENTCLISEAVAPLQWISTNLKSKVKSLKAKVDQLSLQKGLWAVKTKNTMTFSRNVVLAIGATPKTLSHDAVTVIPLKTALNVEYLSQNCNINDTIAVFGSSHSAVTVLMNLLEKCDVSKVYNFYRSPFRYEVDFGDWILFNDTGLKSSAAEWTRTKMLSKIPDKLVRLFADQTNIVSHLPECNKAIYAIGFERRNIAIEGLPEINYNNKYGIIAPGLFGVGIAFPERKTDRYGHEEGRIGLCKFMEYISKVMPIWLHYPLAYDT